MADEAIASQLPAFELEERPLEQCIGQTLRQDIFAERDNPPFDRVCMDGIAIDSAAVGRRNSPIRDIGDSGPGVLPSPYQIVMPPLK